MSPYMLLMMPLMLLVSWLAGGETMEHGMMGGMMGGMRADRSVGFELRYLPVGGVAGPGIPDSLAAFAPTLVAGLESRSEPTSWFGLGLQGNVAMQLSPPIGSGNWVSPYGGILPRLGASVGPVRIDGGVLAGGGVMGRQVGSGTPTLLEVRPIWAVEPRLEVGLQGDRVSGALVGTYLVTPYPGEFGGLSLGLRLSFKGGGHGHGSGHEGHESTHDGRPPRTQAAEKP